MPDAGDFDRDAGPDPGHAADWASAFAMLPAEAPPADGWQRLQARLPRTTPAPRRRVRVPLAFAAAASLVAAVLVALQLRPAATPTPADVTPLAAATPAEGTQDPVASVTVPAPSGDAIAARAAPAPALASGPRNATRRARGVPPSQRPIRTAASRPDAVMVASAGDAAIQPDAPGAVDSRDLETLYAQSAQLESLLALARDDRVSSGTAAALTDALDDQVARIDASLIQPAITPDRRDALWRERVETLRQLVGIETTQRLYASRGERYDAALVSID